MSDTHASQGSEEQLRQLSEELNAVIWLHDPVEGKSLYVSPAYERLFGNKPEENYADSNNWMSRILEEDRPLVQEAFEKWKESDYDVEYRILRPDGEIRVIHDRGYPVRDEDGNCIRLAGIAEDITELHETKNALQQSRDNYQFALESANAGIFTYEFKTDTLVWDDHSLEIYGLRREHFGGNLKAWEDRLHRDDLAQSVRLFEQALRNKDEKLSLRFRVVTPRAEIRSVLGTMFIKYNAEQEPEYLHGLHFDETKDVAIHEELIDARRRAESANHSKSAFLANMSHEIRSPLNSVMGFLQLMQMEGLEPEQEKWLGMMWRGSEHLLSLINEVLDLSKIEAGMLALRKSDFSLKDMLEETVSIYSYKASKQNIKMQFVPFPGIEGEIRGDKSKLRQILINLLTNALKFTEYGSITVRAGVRQDLKASLEHHGHPDQGTRKFFIEVEDTGLGMSQSELGKVFEPFTQAEAGEQEGSGTGLGLTLCREYAKLMGGDISATSVLRSGSTFTVVFEAEDSIEEASAHEEKEVAALKGLQEGARRIKTLVVDDEPATVLMMSEILHRLACEVSSAGTGENALHALRSNEFELVVLDIRLPGIGGEEILKQIRARYSHEEVKVIIASAGIFEDDRKRLLELGADEVFYKPVRAEKLHAAIARLCR